MGFLSTLARETPVIDDQLDVNNDKFGKMRNLFLFI